jgi:hypothetical protein
VTSPMRVTRLIVRAMLSTPVPVRNGAWSAEIR